MKSRFGSAWTAGVLAVVLVAMPGQAQTAKEKSPVVSGVLSGLVGLGAGHYYANDRKAPIFTVLDLGLWGGTVALASGGSDGAALAMYGVLAGVRIYEIVDGVQAAKRYNKRHGLGFTDFRQPTVGFGLSASPLGDYRSDTVANLWADGGSARDLALGMSWLQNSRPAFAFNVTVDQPGVGFSWSKGF